MDKGKMMELCGLKTGVDAALPEPWLEKVEELGFDRHDILVSVGYSYKKSSFGRPAILPLELLRTMDEKKVPVNWGGKTVEISLLRMVESILSDDNEFEITSR